MLLVLFIEEAEDDGNDNIDGRGEGGRVSSGEAVPPLLLLRLVMGMREDF